MAGSRGGAPGRPPQRAKLSCAPKSAGGGPRGNPRRGFPLFTFVRVRRFVGRWTLRPAARHPISFALAKRNGVSPKEKRLLVLVFLIAGRTLCCTYLKRLPCPSDGHVRTRAQRARLKVSPAFSKAVESRGKASGRPPQRAELSCAQKSAGRGLRGNPRRGFPLFTLPRVRRCVERWTEATLPVHPISLLARKETGWSPKETRFLAGDCTVSAMFDAFLIP